MPNTDGYMTQDSFASDFEIPVDAMDFTDVSGQAGFSVQGNGYVAWMHGSGQNGHVVAHVKNVLKRTGVSGPDSDAVVGYPPFLASQLPTLKNPLSVPPGKGIRINSLDFLYSCNSPNTGLNNSQVILYIVNWINNVAANRITLINYAASPGAVTGFAQFVLNLPVQTQPGFVVTPDTEIVVDFYKSLSSPGQVMLLGCILKCSMNLN